MPSWKNTARVAVGLAVGDMALASTLAQDTPRRTARDLQQLDSTASDSNGGLCQYAVENEDEALARGRDPTVPGTTVNVTNLSYGRLGNHYFTIASRLLSLGYCCKAKFVTLPPKDPILAPGMFGEGVSGPRHFDFSEAPDVPGFNSSSECDADYTMGDYEAYMEFLARGGRPYGYSHKRELALCVRSVRLLECEAVYYFPKCLDVCGYSDIPSDQLATTASVSDSHVEMAGNLVIHVRSGDVFQYKSAYGSYGQPPLSYYVGVINNRDWARVDVVTYGPEGRNENPVVPLLRMLADMETWPNIDFNIHEDRSMDADLQAMLCADALATSRSTIGELTMYHTRAKTVFLSSTCDGFGSTFGHTAGRLIAARYSRDEFFEVQGVTLRPEAPLYTLYEDDHFHRQRALRDARVLRFRWDGEVHVFRIRFGSLG